MWTGQRREDNGRALLQDENDRRGRSVALVLDPARFDPRTASAASVSSEGDDATTYQALLAGDAGANTMKDRYGLATDSTITLRTSDGFRRSTWQA